MLFSLQPLEVRTLFAAGSLDITYGNGAGIGTDLLPVGDLVVSDKALQPGDRVLVAGSFTPKGGSKQNFLARYTAEGRRDTNFAGTTTVTGNPRGVDSIDLMTTQPDGKILVLDRDAGGGMLMIVRLTVSGKVDSTFGNKGVVRVPFSTAREMAVDDFGTIAIVGDDGTNVQVARVSANGAIDANFGNNGVFTGKLNLAGTNSEEVTYTRTANIVSELPDGKVLIAGTFHLHELNPPSDFSHPFVARLTSTGAPDTTFSGNGTVEFTDRGDSTTNGLATLSNGKVLLAISTEDTSTLLRLNADGSVDKKFAFSGAAALDGTSRGILVQPDGKILVQTPSQFQRYEGDGSLDMAFTDNNAGSGDSLVGLGSDGSLLSVAVTFKYQTDGVQFKIRPSRRWSEFAPAGLLAAADLTVAPSGPYRFSIQWRAEAGVDIKTLSTNSIQILGPMGLTYKATFLGTTKTGNGIQRTANYKLAAPGGSWDTSDSGVYTVRLLGGLVTDTQAHAAQKQTLGVFLAVL